MFIFCKGILVNIFTCHQNKKVQNTHTDHWRSEKQCGDVVATLVARQTSEAEVKGSNPASSWGTAESLCNTVEG